jgi:hypothetical protein
MLGICLTKVLPYFILNNNNHVEEQYGVLRGEREEGVPVFFGDLILLENGEHFIVK